MKSSRPSFAVISLSLLFTFAISIATATAGSLGNGAAQRQRLVVESVNTTGGTVVFKSMVDQSTHTYKIDAATKISLTQKKATIDQIKPGQKVVNYTVRGGKAVDGSPLDMLMLWPAAPATP